MTAHCATCNCKDDDRPAQPATSSEWARRQALEAAAAAVQAAKDARKKPACTCGHGDLAANFHMTPCPIKVAHLADIRTTRVTAGHADDAQEESTDA